jgi:hypothetical protein
MVGYTIQKKLLIERSRLFELIDRYPITVKINHSKNKAIKNKELIDIICYFTLNPSTSSDLKSLIVGGNELSDEVRSLINKTNSIKYKHLIDYIKIRNNKRMVVPSDIKRICVVIREMNIVYNLRKDLREFPQI